MPGKWGGVRRARPPRSANGQLGEHGAWCKQTNFELATQAPMMVHIPGKTDDGITTEKLVEMVDLFPTIVEAAGFPPIPLCP